MNLPPAQPTTNLQPTRNPVDPNAALQAQEAAKQQQQEQMMQMIMAIIMKLMGGGAGQPQPGADVGGGMGALLGGAAPPNPYEGASASPGAPPVPIKGVNGGF